MQSSTSCSLRIPLPSSYFHFIISLFSCLSYTQVTQIFHSGPFQYRLLLAWQIISQNYSLKINNILQILHVKIISFCATSKLFHSSYIEPSSHKAQVILLIIYENNSSYFTELFTVKTFFTSILFKLHNLIPGVEWTKLSQSIHTLMSSDTWICLTVSLNKTKWNSTWIFSFTYE